MTALVIIACWFALSLTAGLAWVVTCELADRRTNARRARLSNRSLERIAGRR